MNNQNFIHVKIDKEQLEYAKNLQNLLCERLDTKLPVEYGIPDIIIEQALFLYIDTMERYYRLEGKDWEHFYNNSSGVTNVPRRIEDFREQNIKPYKK